MTAQFLLEKAAARDYVEIVKLLLADGRVDPIANHSATLRVAEECGQKQCWTSRHFDRSIKQACWPAPCYHATHRLILQLYRQSIKLLVYTLPKQLLDINIHLASSVASQLFSQARMLTLVVQASCTSESDSHCRGSRLTTSKSKTTIRLPSQFY